MVGEAVAGTSRDATGYQTSVTSGRAGRCSSSTVIVRSPTAKPGRDNPSVAAASEGEDTPTRYGARWADK